MYALAPEQKRHLMETQRKMKPKPPPPTAGYASYGPSSAAALMPRLVPQLTGDTGILRRLSTWGAPVIEETSQDLSSGELSLGTGGSAQGQDRAQAEKMVDTPPLQPQSTGGLWSWWTKEQPKTVKDYVNGIRSTKADTKLVRHLIELRVQLSTAQVPWVQEFLGDEHGLDVLGTLLAGFVAKGGKRRNLTVVEDIVVQEIIKCVRALLNTDPGYNAVLASPTTITHTTYSLHASSIKLRVVVSEVLCGICLLTPREAHKAVLAAFSDYRIAHDEQFRFEELIGSLRLPDVNGDADSDGGSEFGGNEENIWEARLASMQLVNTIIHCPEFLQDRVVLREEFGRRGLNEVVVVCGPLPYSSMRCS
jgi:hypothetical protein